MEFSNAFFSLFLASFGLLNRSLLLRAEPSHDKSYQEQDYSDSKYVERQAHTHHKDPWV